MGLDRKIFAVRFISEHGFCCPFASVVSGPGQGKPRWGKNCLKALVDLPVGPASQRTYRCSVILQILPGLFQKASSPLCVNSNARAGPRWVRVQEHLPRIVQPCGAAPYAFDVHLILNTGQYPPTPPPPPLSDCRPCLSHVLPSVLASSGDCYHFVLSLLIEAGAGMNYYNT